MKIIITESQFYDLIPQNIKRRLSPGDLESLDNIIKRNMTGHHYLSDSFFGYSGWVIGDSLNEFVLENKSDDVDMGPNDWEDDQNKILRIFRPLIPFLEKKYHDEFWEFYNNYNK